MKRANDTSAATSAPRAKRSKTSQACTSCRKHKTRCELPSEPGVGRCHRCNVLRHSCSFEGTDVIASGLAAAAATASPPASRDEPSLPVTSPDEGVSPGDPSRYNADAFSAEDLVMGPRMTKGDDPDNGPGYWATSPMGAIWDIMRKRSVATQAAPVEPLPVCKVLSEDQVHYLMNMFDKHYVPWLNIPFLRTAPDAPINLQNFLVLACCSVACRHLPDGEAARVQARLQQLAEHAVLLRTFDPAAHASLEGVQALLVLANWSPAIGAVRADVQDGSLIASGAVRMALALKLEQTSERAVKMQEHAKEVGGFTEEQQIVHDELMWKARLWASVCNTEWNLTTGTYRKPISVRTPYDHRAVDWRLFPGKGTFTDSRDFRLGIIAQVHEATNRGLDKTFKNLDQFSDEINELMTVFNHARNVVQPLRYTSPIERLHMDILYLQQHAGRLLVLFHGLANIRAWMGAHIKDRPWMLEAEQSGLKFVKQWGMQILHTAQSVIELFFGLLDRYHDYFGAGAPGGAAAATDDPRPLAPAPDALYATVLFAASVLLVSRYTMFLQFAVRDAVFLHTSATLLRQLTHALDGLALGPEHAPRKAAAVVHELQRVWHDKVLSQAGDRAVPPPDMLAARGWLGMKGQRAPTDTSALTDAATPSDQSSPRDSTGSVTHPVSAERASANTGARPTGNMVPPPMHDPLGLGSTPMGEQFFNWTGVTPTQPYDYGAPPPAMEDLSTLDQMFFPNLDPTQFFDTGFWSLFSTIDPSSAPQPPPITQHPVFSM